MDKNKVERIVKGNIKRLKKKLELEKWDITFEYESLDDGDFAMCTPSIKYQHVIIRIDPNQMYDKAHILHVMLHELLHCLTCTFMTYRLAVARLIDVERAYDAANVIYDRAEEELVTTFCRILEGMKSEK